MLLVLVLSTVWVLLRIESLRLEKVLLELSRNEWLIVVLKRLLLVMLRFVMMVRFIDDERIVLLVMVLLSMTLWFENVLMRLAFTALRRSRFDSLAKVLEMLASVAPDCSM